MVLNRSVDQVAKSTWERWKEKDALLVVSLLIGIQLVEDRMNKYIFLLWKVAAINTGKRQCAQRIGFLETSLKVKLS